MRAAALLLWVACAATLPAPRAARVEVTDRVRQEALHNEINWEGRRPRAPQVLRVGSPLTQQALKVGEDTLRCTLAGLQPSSAYEVRVSYAGTIPAAVRVAFRVDGRGAGAPRRALLDVEKLEFRTDAAGGVAGHARAGAPPEVAVTARAAGVLSQGGRARGGGFLLLDVVLSPVEGGLPAEARQLTRWLLGCAVFVAAAMAVVPVGGLTRHPAQRFMDARAAAAAAQSRQQAWT